VTFPQGFEVSQGTRLELAVRTTNPKMPSIHVGISQMPKPTAPVTPVSAPIKAATPPANPPRVSSVAPAQ